MLGKLLKQRQDLWGGMLIAGCGGLTILEAYSYQVGDLARMGPGYFPLMIGCILVLLGVLIPFFPEPPDPVEEEAAQGKQVSCKDRLRGMGFIIAGIVAFIVVGHYFGFLPATFAIVFISALGDTSNTVPSAAILAAAVTVLGVVVFSWGLQLQFPLIRWG